MIRTLVRYTPELILLIYVCLFLGFKEPTRAWDRVINSDGKGYYAYLPAIFIYQDLDYKFVEEYERIYYPSDRSVFKEFRSNQNGQTVNKYFAGLALLWIPFFFLAHLITLIAGLSPDGYNIIYQYTIGAATLFYLWAGCRALFTILPKLGASLTQASFITLAITLGTNIIFYAIVEPSMSHVYSFALVSLLILSGLNYFQTKESHWFMILAALYGVIVLIRPTNLLTILLIPFMAGSLPALKDGIVHLWKRKSRLIFSILVFIGIIAIQPLLYYFQSGHLWIYSYGEEKLELLNPKVISILFSYNRGWFIYTPLALVSFAGFRPLFRDNKTRFFSLVTFLTAAIYLASCWWVFYYASKCGQRVFIDLYPVLALLLFYLISHSRSIIWRTIWLTIISLLIFLNIFQFYQHKNWIFPAADITRDIYFDAFTTIFPKAVVYIPEEAVVSSQSILNNMEESRGWMNEQTLTGNHSFSGSSSSLINENTPYGIGLELKPISYYITNNKVVKVKAMVWSGSRKASTSVVLDLSDTSGFYCYRAFYLERFIHRGEWIPVECAFYLPDGLPKNALMKLYFYHPHGASALYIDDLTVEFISLKDEPEYQKIEGVLLSCR